MLFTPYIIIIFQPVGIMVSLLRMCQIINMYVAQGLLLIPVPLQHTKKVAILSSFLKKSK